MESPFKETISKLPFEGLCDMRAPWKYLETNKSKVVLKMQRKLINPCCIWTDALWKLKAAIYFNCTLFEPQKYLSIEVSSGWKSDRFRVIINPLESNIFNEALNEKMDMIYTKFWSSHNQMIYRCWPTNENYYPP